MYNLSYFKEPDKNRILAFMHAHPFVTLCGSTAEGLPVATQVPVLIDTEGEHLVLQGHFMRKTDHHLAFVENPNALILFTGAHEYVSASWYDKPNQASTWNYMTVHARGKIEFTSDDALIEILKKTTAHFEKDDNSPASFANLPHDYVHNLAKAIVGFRIRIEKMDNVFKLSQNRNKKSYMTIMDRLKKSGADGEIISGEMEKRTHELFGDDHSVTT